MKRARSLLVFVSVAPLVWPAAIVANEKEKAPEPRPAPRAAPAPAGTLPTSARASLPPPTYRLPKVGKPRRRVGGGRRGPDAALPELFALVPEHVGLTISSRPELYWYIAEGSTGDVRFELTLIDDVSIDPLLDVRIDEPGVRGMQRIDLGEHGVDLEPGREYQWSVALVPDPEHRSRDVVATGWIERVAPPSDLEAQLSAAGAAGRGGVYAQAGLWYDALASLAAQASEHPDDSRYRAQVEHLLAQADLALPPLDAP
jgi:hypothetical protein